MTVSPDAPSVGRNDPCPCGSGRKYKKCCLDRAASGTGNAPVTQADRDHAVVALMRYAEGPQFAEDHRVAATVFWGGRSEEEVERVLELGERAVEIFYNAWFVFDVDIEDGETVVDLFLRDRAADLSPAERTFLGQVRDTHLSLYEVERVEPERGLHLRDLWTDARHRVRERAATRSIHRWDVIAARLFEREPGTHVLEGGMYRYPRERREEILATLRDYHRDVEEASPGIGRTAFFKRIGFVFHHLWMHHVALAPTSMPTLGTPEGDPLAFVESRFEVVDAEALAEALQEHPEIEPTDEDLDWVWLEPTDDEEGPRRVLGSLAQTGDRLILETMSETRAERGRDMLEAAAGEAIRHLVTAVEDAARMLDEASRREPDAGERPTAPDADMERLGRQVLDRHYQAWPDTELPALDGLTPREAAADPAVRPRVIELLKTIENRPPGGPLGATDYDFGWLWDEIGLERP